MNNSRKHFKRVRQLAYRWQKRTMQVLKMAKDKLDVGDSGELERSLKSNVRSEFPLIKILFLMRVRGRFVDMGAGRGYRNPIETREGNKARIKRRKPKKWYSRPFYGRLNDLQGAIGFTMMEASLDATAGVLKKK